MKRCISFPLLLFVVSAFILAGCAGSSSTASDATDSSSTTNSNNSQANASTSSDSDISLKDAIAYEDMFKDIPDTKQYDLISLAKTSPNLSTFTRLVDAADISKALTADKKFTIFAPTNAAFQSIPEEDLAMLIKPENRTALIQLLQLHILPNEVISSRFSDNQRIKAGTDHYINVALNGATNEITIGGASIVKADVQASNGILHVMNGVIKATPSAND